METKTKNDALTPAATASPRPQENATAAIDSDKQSVCSRLNRYVLIPLTVVLLLAWIGSPFFLHLDSDGAVCFTSGQKNNKPLKEKQFDVELSIICGAKAGFTLTAEGQLHNRTASLRYVNAAMGVAAYILGIIFLSFVLRALCRAERRRRLIENCNRDFESLFAASPDRETHQKEFLNEMIRVYFGPEEE